MAFDLFAQRVLGCQSVSKMGYGFANRCVIQPIDPNANARQALFGETSDATPGDCPNDK
jgi:hypothetical protein